MLYTGGCGCSESSRSIQRDGRGCSCIQRDPGGWEGMFLHPEGSMGMGGDVSASHSPIPHPNIRNGPGNPGFDPPNLCGSQVSRDGCLLPKLHSCYSRGKDPGSQRAPHSPIPSFPSPEWISHPLEQLSTFAGEGPGPVGHSVVSATAPRDLPLPSRKSCTKGSLRWIQEQSSARDEKITALPFRTNTQLSPP